MASAKSIVQKVGRLSGSGSDVIVLVTLVGALMSGCLAAQPPDTTGTPRVIKTGEVAENIDRYLARVTQDGFNGSVVIAIDGQVVLQRGYGGIDSSRQVPVTAATPYWIASISKQFAAAAVLRLAGSGRLAVENPIAKFFPDAPADKREITLHHLLTHTAGLEQHYAADGIADRDAAVRAILAHPLARPPGEGFGYSNDAYNLIAAIVEIASGQSFEQYLTEHVLKPAGMRHTGFWGPADHPEVAPIHEEDFGDTAILARNWGFLGATGMYSSSIDLYRWYLTLQGNAVLPVAARQQLFAPHVTRGTLGVGYGWFVSTTPRGTTSLWTRGYEGFGHGAVIASYPDEEVVIVVTTNAGETSSGMPFSHQLAETLAEMVFEPR